MLRPNFIKTRRISRANNVTALIPQMWAQESVALLTENMQIANTIHRDFEEIFARFGDTVNTRQPSNFTAKRKNKGSNVTAEDAVLNNIPVVLNQHIYHSFLLDDSDLTLAMQDLIDVFIKPAAVALAKMVDQICLSQVYQFTPHQVGEIGGLANNNGNALLAMTRGKMNGNLVPDDGRRYLALGHGADAKMMENAIFTQADQRGDVEGLMFGYLGTKQGLHTYMSQNTPALLPSTVSVAGAINNGNIAAGSTELTVDGFLDDAPDGLTVGDWIRIGKFYYQATVVNQRNATAITISPGLIEATVNDAVITRYGRLQINEAGHYAAGYAEAIAFNNPTATPQVGQMVTFHESTTKYAIVQTGTTSILLDRPLEAGVSHQQWAHLGPVAGGFNFGYHRNCMTLALRPLAAPRGGVEGYSTNWSGIPMRAVITYDGQAQKHRVTLDFLAGIKVLDTALGVVVLS